MLDLGQRRRQPEIMDQPGLDIDEHRQALRGLERINSVSGSVRVLWPALRELARQVQPQRVRVLDIATGAGDVPISLWHRARRAGIDLQVDGWDVSPTAIDYARARAADCKAEVQFHQRDALRDDIPPDYDAIVSSLFLHHLDEEQAVELLRRMAAATRRLVLINDLARSTFNFFLVRLATRLLSLSPVVHVDGPRSVEAAFTPGEILELADRAGLDGVQVTRRFPCRFLLSWRRP